MDKSYQVSIELLHLISNDLTHSIGTSGGGGSSSNLVDAGTTQTGTGEGDDAYSQAESSIKDGEIVASAQGTKNGGTAQTQVQGSYSGTGSFSASAQTSDKDRAAQAQVRIKYKFKKKTNS